MILTPNHGAGRRISFKSGAVTHPTQHENAAGMANNNVNLGMRYLYAARHFIIDLTV